MRTKRSTSSTDSIHYFSLYRISNSKPKSKTLWKVWPCIEFFFFSRLQQPGDPVEVCQPGAEADERLPGGISVWPQGGDVASDLFNICFRVWRP